MARSAEIAFVALAGAGLLVAGCSTTQQKSARAKLQAERLLASREKVLVTQANPLVRVERVSVVRHGRRSAVAVVLHNTGSVPVSDLPISLRSGGRYLNRRAGLGYFSTHTPAIAPGASLTWVFLARARVRGVTARVGTRPAVSERAGKLPVLTASGTTVTNKSGVPQYGLVVYAVAERGSRLVAAGRASLPSLGPGKSASVPLSLVGATRGAQLRLEAPPTIFK